MFNKNLSDIILENLAFLKLKKEFFKEQKNVLRYFLHKDIETLLGKDKFSFDFKDAQKNEIEFDKIFVENRTVIFVQYLGEVYYIFEENDGLVIIHNEEKVAQIRQNGKLQNMFLNPNENEKTIEVQNVYTYPEKIFEYSKTVYNEEGQITYPKIKMKEIGSKCKDYDYFTISYGDCTLEEKNFFQKIVSFFNFENMVKVKTSYNVEDILDYVESIFTAIEKEVQKLSRKR